MEIVHDEFARCVTKKDDSSDTKSASGVEITLHKNPFGEGRTVKLPLPVIRSTAVLLSIWKEEYAEDEKKAADRVNNLTDCLMRTVGSHEAGRSDEELVSAKGICETGDAAPVEFVSALLNYSSFQDCLFWDLTLPFFSLHSGLCWRRLEVIQSQEGQPCLPLPLSCLACYCALDYHARLC